MAAVEPLPAGTLRKTFDPGQFRFETTAELEPMGEVIGQQRAVDAIRFGAGIRQEGYNVFAFGPPGTGRHAIIQQFLERKARDEDRPPDWCYVNNFEEPQHPRVLRLPAGWGARFRADMEGFVDELQAALPAAFESEDYRTRKQAIQSEFEERPEKAIADLRERAAAAEIALIRTPVGLALGPLRDGEVLSPEEFEKLPEEDQKRIKADLEKFQEELQAILRKVPQWEREQREKVRELNRQIARFALGHLLDDLRQHYAELPKVLEFLDAVRDDALENPDQFLRSGEQAAEPGPGAPTLPVREPGGLGRYRVNLIVDHSRSEGAPVIYESDPSFNKLVGRMEHIAQFGALFTNFTLLRPGALHLANGGYLLLDARKLLMQPLAWECLKRALSTRQVRIESMAEMLSLVSTVSLEPDAIPLDVKVILVGEPEIYYLLSAYDPDFEELFKVPVDFDDRMERTPDNSQLYVRLLGTLAKRDGLRPLDRDAAARVVDQAAWVARDSEKLSTRVSILYDLVRESDYWAGLADRPVITRGDVDCAITAQVRRSDRLRERVHEEIQRQTLLVDTEGEQVGQCNGLSVMQLGGFSFGRPSRITARVRLGKGEVVDIEREVELGGPLHSKGVLILAGFLGQRYAQELPLSLSASLVFEQSYSGVDGDSASAAELCALLSSLAQAPIRQSLAITGSVNQHGRIQAIGGANEKIEGFFDVCKARGLSGEQGVLIPAANVKHLMLRPDVVEAAARGQFRVYPVEDIDQCLELLTSQPAGAPGEDGRFPEGSLNRRIRDRLEQFARRSREFLARGQERGGDGR